MNPVNNLQVAIKNNVDVFYFATLIPGHVLFGTDGLMEKKTYLSTWKDIPSQNEVQSTISGVSNMSADALEARLKENNVYTVAKRNIDGQELMYQSVKLINGIWCLIELTIQPANSSIQVSLKARVTDTFPAVQKALQTLLAQ